VQRLQLRRDCDATAIFDRRATSVRLPLDRVTVVSIHCVSPVVKFHSK